MEFLARRRIPEMVHCGGGRHEGAILNLTLQAALAISSLDLSQAYSYVIILFKIKNEQTKPNKTL